MEVELAETVVGEEVMEQADGAVGSLPDADPFVNEVVDLCNVLLYWSLSYVFSK